MKEVTKKEFFEAIGHQDAIVSVKGNYPYTSNFTLRNSQRLLGQIVDVQVSPAIVESHYYLPD